MLRQGQRSISEDEQRRVDAFLQLTRVERGLRVFVEARLSEHDGQRWARSLPRDVREKVEAAGLTHIDFPDLRKILSSAWRRLGEVTEAVDKRQVLVHLEGLEPIRNDIAHSRDVSPQALTLAQAAYYVLLPLIEDAVAVGDFPPTAHVDVIIDRLRGSIAHDGALSEADLEKLHENDGYVEIVDALANYARVRARPGRDPVLLEQTRMKAIQALDRGRLSHK